MYKYHSFYTITGEYKSKKNIEHFNQEEEDDENNNDIIKLKCDGKYIKLEPYNITNTYVLTSTSDLTDNYNDATNFTINNIDSENVEVKVNNLWLTNRFKISNNPQSIKYNKDDETLSFNSILNNSNTWEIEHTNSCHPNINESLNSILNSLNGTDMSEFEVIKDEDGENIFRNQQLDQIYQILNILINSSI